MDILLSLEVYFKVHSENQAHGGGKGLGGATWGVTGPAPPPARIFGCWDPGTQCTACLEPTGLRGEIVELHAMDQGHVGPGGDGQACLAGWLVAWSDTDIPALVAGGARTPSGRFVPAPLQLH